MTGRYSLALLPLSLLSAFSSAIPPPFLPSHSPPPSPVRGALILTMAGSGAPAYLQASCLSIASSSGQWDMLLFHEDNEYIMNMTCAENVKKINVHIHGLAGLITEAICKAHWQRGSSSTSDVFQDDACGELGDAIDTVLSKLPYYLAEVKIGSGAIFSDYLTEYSHWTYTDPDIIWGNLSNWITDFELKKFDVITLSKFNDARRLFLRGQFTLHKNTPLLNWKWSSLTHMSAPSVLSRMNKVIVLLSQGCSIARLKRLTFVSAEGAYSTHIFESLEFSVLVAGRMMSDRVTKPVVWTDGMLWRCDCAAVSDCMLSSMGNHACLSPPPNLSALQAELALVPFQTRRGDCGMNWLPRRNQLCGIPPSSRTKTNHAVLWKGESEWSVDDDSLTFRSAAKSGAMFHFRIWEDLLSKSLRTSFGDMSSSASSNSNLSCFITYLNLDKNVIGPLRQSDLSECLLLVCFNLSRMASCCSQILDFSSCDTHEMIEDVPVFTWRQWRATKNREWRSQQRREEMLADDDFFYHNITNEQ